MTKANRLKLAKHYKTIRKIKKHPYFDEFERELRNFRKAPEIEEREVVTSEDLEKQRDEEEKRKQEVSD